MQVVVRHDREDAVERALKKLKKKLFDDGRIKEKPSTIRRRKREEAALRNKRRVENEKARLRRRGMAR